MSRPYTPKNQALYDKVLAAPGPKLNLFQENLTAADAKDIAAALKQNSRVTNLDAWGNEFGDEGIIALAEVPTITTLNVASNKFGDKGAKALAKNNTITTLDVSENQITDNGARAFISNHILTTLNITGNGINKDLLKEISESIAQNPRYKPHNQKLYDEVLEAKGPALILSRRRLGDDEVMDVAEALKKNPKITALDLSVNAITNAGLKLLKSNTGITELLLASNLISDKGVLDFFTSNNTVTTFSVFGNHVTTELRPAIDLFLSKNRALTEATGPRYSIVEPKLDAGRLAGTHSSSNFFKM